MSLDDIIKKSKENKRNSNVARRGRSNFAKSDGIQKGRRKRFDQTGEAGRKKPFNNNPIRKRGGFRRFNNFNKNEDSNGRGNKVGV